MGNTTLFIPSFFASIHIGNIPSTLLIFPSSDNSPINIVFIILEVFIHLIQASIPIAIGKSKNGPSFFISAGAKFITIFLLFISYPEFLIAVLTLSFASFTLVSGKPTISQDGIPADTSTSTSIR